MMFTSCSFYISINTATSEQKLYILTRFNKQKELSISHSFPPNSPN